MATPAGRRKKPSNAEIVAELNIRVRQHLSEQLLNASEVEAEYDRLPSERRKEVKELIGKRLPR